MYLQLCLFTTLITTIDLFKCCFIYSHEVIFLLTE